MSDSSAISSSDSFDSSYADHGAGYGALAGRDGSAGGDSVSDSDAGSYGDAASYGGAASDGDTDGRGLPSWLLYLVVAVAVIGAVAIYLSSRTTIALPVVGDCIAANQIDGAGARTTLPTVKCTDPTAAYLIVGIIEQRPQERASFSECATTWSSATRATWYGEAGKPGALLCLAPAGRAAAN